MARFAAQTVRGIEELLNSQMAVVLQDLRRIFENYKGGDQTRILTRKIPTFGEKLFAEIDETSLSCSKISPMVTTMEYGDISI